ETRHRGAPGRYLRPRPRHLGRDAGGTRPHAPARSRPRDRGGVATVPLRAGARRGPAARRRRRQGGLMVLDRARLGRSFAVAGQGLARAWARQPNLRIEVGIGVAAVGLAAWLRAPAAPILLACALVIALELMNSAVEAAVDLAMP